MSLRTAINEVKAKLRTITDFNYVRMFNDQFNLDDSGRLDGITWPSAFVEIVSPNDANPLLGGFSSGVLTWRIHIGAVQYDDGLGNFDENLEIFDLKSKVVKALTGFKPDGSGHFMKTGEAQDYGHKATYHYIVDFTAEFIDADGKPTNTIQFGPPIELVINVEIPDFNNDWSNDFDIWNYTGSTIYNIRDYII